MLSKNISIYFVIALISFIGGLVFDSKILSKPCPECPKIEIPPCPPQTKLDLQSFDVKKIKGLKSFTYSPSISGQIIIVSDSSTYKKLIKK
jgi:hypothetical protein